VHYLRANTRDGEPIFTFPSIEILCFLADRPNATRHGYFFPGWPGHDVEAEVVAMLRAGPPRFVVTLQTNPFFFFDAPIYYYALRDFVRTNYRQVASFREYAVLARRDVPEDNLMLPVPVPAVAEATLDAEYGAALRGAPDERLAAARALEAERLDFAWDPIVAALDDPAPAVRDAAVVALNGAASADVAAALADALRREMVPPTSRIAAFRRLVAIGDARIIRPLLEILPATTDDRERNAVLGGLEVVARKLVISDHWFGEWRPPDVRAADLPALRRLRRRLADPSEDHTFRMFLAQLLPRIGHANLAPALWAALGSEAVDLRLVAAAGLMRLGQDGRSIALADVVLPQIVRAPRVVPSMVFEMYRRDPPAMRRRFLRILRHEGFVFDRIAVAWVVAATGDPAFRDALVRQVGSDSRELRLAGLAGLGRLADPTTRPAIEAGLQDPDFMVRDFAARALAALPPS
jgi:HEAT repeat protein